MANIKSSKKRAKQAVVRNARNASQRSMLRTAVKKVLKALGENDATGAETAFATRTAGLAAAAKTPGLGAFAARVSQAARLSIVSFRQMAP